MENKIFCYVCYGRKMVKANGSIEYKGGQIITKFINVHISYAEFVSIVCDRLKVHATSVSQLHTVNRDYKNYINITHHVM